MRLLLVIAVGCYGVTGYSALSNNKIVKALVGGSAVALLSATLACSTPVPKIERPTDKIRFANHESGRDIDQLLPDQLIDDFTTVAMVVDDDTVIDLSSDKVDVVLTFDDGPDSRSGLVNGTRRVLDILQDNQLRAVFFIQSHARNDNNRYFRGMEEKVGIPLVERMQAEGHLVGVHTGVDGQRAHSWANRHPQREAIGELGNDLQRCKNYIKRHTGSDPCYVRPPFGEYNRAVRQRYADYDLNMILWHIDSRDSTSSYDSQDIERHLRSRVSKLVARGQRQLIILFHDIDQHTYRDDNLLNYLKAIEETINAHGLNADFDLTREEIDSVFDL